MFSFRAFFLFARKGSVYSPVPERRRENKGRGLRKAAQSHQNGQITQSSISPHATAANPGSWSPAGLFCRTHWQSKQEEPVFLKPERVRSH